MSGYAITIAAEGQLIPEVLRVDNNKNFLQLKKMVEDLQESMKKIYAGSLPEAEREICEMMASKTRDFFAEIERYILSLAGDLKKTREELKKSSSKLLIQATEQLDNVTKSTQKVADNVMNRIDKISEKQNVVLEHLNDIRKNVGIVASESVAKLVIESTDMIEKEESEIQIEAFEIMNEMQFQDITAQQIQQVITLIGETENKLMDFGQLLGFLSGENDTQERSKSGERAFDPNATMEDREKRQSLADKITREFPKKN